MAWHSESRLGPTALTNLHNYKKQWNSMFTWEFKKVYIYFPLNLSSVLLQGKVALLFIKCVAELWKHPGVLYVITALLLSYLFFFCCGKCSLNCFIHENKIGSYILNVFFFTVGISVIYLLVKVYSLLVKDELYFAWKLFCHQLSFLSFQR